MVAISDVKILVINETLTVEPELRVEIERSKVISYGDFIDELLILKDLKEGLKNKLNQFFSIRY